MGAGQSMVHNATHAAARTLFRRRDAIFPLFFLALFVVLLPRPPGDPLGDALLWTGLALVAAGEIVRVLAVGLDYVKRGGKGKRFYADRLVTGGLFAHSRNPLYLGNVALLIGFLLIAGNLVAIAVAGPLVLLAYHVIVRGEEQYLSERFGPAYRVYCERVPRWRLRLRGLSTTLRSHPFDWRMVANKEYGTLFVAMVVPLTLVGAKVVRAEGWSGLGDRLPLFAVAGGMAVAAYVAARALKKAGRLQPRSATATVPGLPALRSRLDRIDARILRLLNERAAIVSEVFERKEAADVPRFDRGRTEAIVDRLVRTNRGPLDDAAVRRLFGSMLEYFAFEHDPARVPEAERTPGKRAGTATETGMGTEGEEPPGVVVTVAAGSPRHAGAER